jgi:CheY-like chemotaxis protein
MGAPAMRVLIVEDDALVARGIAEMLEFLGHLALGPMLTVNDVKAAVVELKPDVALLDCGLGASGPEDIADALRFAKVPFVWATGSYEEMPGDEPVLRKPFIARQLEPALLNAVREVAVA